MKLIVDDKIPYIREVLDELADEVVYLPGSEICAADVKDADGLIVRTRTRCDEQLLSGSRVSIVATATIGYDHLDIDYLQRAGIQWMNCPGCNAGSVAQYVRSVLILLEREGWLRRGQSVVGVVGCGHVGSLVRQLAQEMGYAVVVSDPPLGMECDLRECDLITYHVPLTRCGDYPTYHMADERFLQSLSRRPIIVNTSRGAVVDNDALLRALCMGRVRQAVLDVWEGEPHVNLALLNKVYIGTPHIAGYSADGKVNADNMVIEGLCRHFGMENRWHIEPPAIDIELSATDTTDDQYLRYYNPLTDSQKLKNAPADFELLRGNYPVRRECSFKKP